VTQLLVGGPEGLDTNTRLDGEKPDEQGWEQIWLVYGEGCKSFDARQLCLEFVEEGIVKLCHMECSAL